MVQVALRYLLDDPATHTVVLGAKSIDEYRDAVAATELSPLTEGERRTIAELRRRLREGPALKRMLKRLVGRKG
jgi:aryl-alcohol dehydrogenase-like predicted oxidoreductase